ncbi:unnamed protein product [Amoebophrya sp. A25]|nr:unnamed protein product [Amoebophrya sp. A25]|eukprot:GSA25T00003911001.1
MSDDASSSASPASTSSRAKSKAKGNKAASGTPCGGARGQSASGDEGLPGAASEQQEDQKEKALKSKTAAKVGARAAKSPARKPKARAAEKASAASASSEQANAKARGSAAKRGRSASMLDVDSSAPTAKVASAVSPKLSATTASPKGGPKKVAANAKASANNLSPKMAPAGTISGPTSEAPSGLLSQISSGVTLPNKKGDITPGAASSSSGNQPESPRLAPASWFVVGDPNSVPEMELTPSAASTTPKGKSTSAVSRKRTLSEEWMEESERATSGSASTTAKAKGGAASSNAPTSKQSGSTSSNAKKGKAAAKEQSAGSGSGSGKEKEASSGKKSSSPARGTSAGASSSGGSAASAKSSAATSRRGAAQTTVARKTATTAPSRISTRDAQRLANKETKPASNLPPLHEDQTAQVSSGRDGGVASPTTCMLTSGTTTIRPNKPMLDPELRSKPLRRMVSKTQDPLETLIQRQQSAAQMKLEKEQLQKEDHALALQQEEDDHDVVSSLTSTSSFTHGGNKQEEQLEPSAGAPENSTVIASQEGASSTTSTNMFMPSAPNSQGLSSSVKLERESEQLCVSNSASASRYETALPFRSKSPTPGSAIAKAFYTNRPPPPGGRRPASPGSVPAAASLLLPPPPHGFAANVFGDLSRIRAESGFAPLPQTRAAKDLELLESAKQQADFLLQGRHTEPVASQAKFKSPVSTILDRYSGSVSTDLGVSSSSGQAPKVERTVDAKTELVMIKDESEEVSDQEDASATAGVANASAPASELTFGPSQREQSDQVRREAMRRRRVAQQEQRRQERRRRKRASVTDPNVEQVRIDPHGSKSSSDDGGDSGEEDGAGGGAIFADGDLELSALHDLSEHSSQEESDPYTIVNRTRLGIMQVVGGREGEQAQAVAVTTATPAVPGVTTTTRTAAVAVPAVA